MKRLLILVCFAFRVASLVAQRHYDYDDSGVTGGADRAFNGLILIIILVIGAIVLLLLGNLFFKIYYGVNPEAKLEPKANKTKEARVNAQKVKIKHNDTDSLYVPIDLGLSVKWGSINFGVKEAWETFFGKHYCWGELHSNTLGTYDLSNIDFGVVGDISGNPQFDIVSISLSNGWRIPTKKELQELVEKCKWAKSSNGYNVTGPNGNSIFLPNTGYITLNGNPFGPEHHDEGYYWSSTPKEESTETLNHSAYSLSFGGHYQKPTIQKRIGHDALMIRPVKDY